MTGRESAGSRRAGLFDLRLILAVLFLLYGLIVLIMGIAATDDADLAKAGGVNVNLWMGIAMLVVSVLFGLWAFLRPVVIPVEADQEETGSDVT